jgi:hypothetical protein
MSEYLKFLIEQNTDWKKHVELLKFFKIEGFETEEDYIESDKYQWSKTIGEVPHTKTISVSLRDDIFEVNVSQSDMNRSHTFGDEFYKEESVIKYVSGVINGEIVEQVIQEKKSKDASEAYEEIMQKQLLKNSQNLKKTLEGTKVDTKKKKKKDEEEPKKSYSKGYGLGYWGGQYNLNSFDSPVGDVGGNGVGTFDGGDGGGGE